MPKGHVRCTSCGYRLRHTVPGKGCETPALHQFDLDAMGSRYPKMSSEELIAQYRENQKHYTIYNATSPIPEWVLAFITVQAYRAGMSKAQFTADLLTQWAREQGAEP